MALTAAKHWHYLQRVNFDFTPIARGSLAFRPQDAVATLSRRTGMQVQQAPLARETGDLFLEGTLGEPVSGKPRDVFHVVADRVASDALGIPSGAKTCPVKHWQDSPIGLHVTGQQTVDGLPVYGSEITVHLDWDGRPYAITGRPFPEVLGAALRQPSFERANPVSVLSKELGLKLSPEETRVDELSALVDGEFVACFQVKALTLEPFATWSALVGRDGKLLAVYNIASALCGEADVFIENPLRGPARRVRLDHLDNAGPTSLYGRYAAVSNFSTSGATATNGAFLFPETNPHFDEPNLYFFLDHTRAAFDALTGDPCSASGPFGGKVQFNPICAFVHVPSAANNAFYDPLKGALYFGDIGIDATERYTSRSRDIVVHEFSHAVSDSICRLGRTWPHTQSRAMSEGYSDYFAASFMDWPVIGDYFMNEAAGFRNCDHATSFPGGYAGDEHSVGEVWAGFLWSLRQDQSIGKGIADVLAFQSLFFLGPWRTIEQGLEAVLLSDRQLFPTDQTHSLGRHEDRIKELFRSRRP